MAGNARALGIAGRRVHVVVEQSPTLVGIQEARWRPKAGANSPSAPWSNTKQRPGQTSDTSRDEMQMQKRKRVRGREGTSEAGGYAWCRVYVVGNTYAFAIAERRLHVAA